MEILGSENSLVF